MKTITLNLYKFNELSEAAKQIAIKNYRNSEKGNECLFNFKEDCIEKAKESENIEINDLIYSLSYCQGDGLSFSGYIIDMEKEFLACFPHLQDRQIYLDTLCNNIRVAFEYNKGYYCYASKNNVSFDCPFLEDKHPNLHEYANKFEDYIIDKYMQLCKELEKDGYNEIEYQYSDEYISECLAANEYDFTEDGVRY